jgi:NADH-quinone oxidoreductase subunit I
MKFLKKAFVNLFKTPQTVDYPKTPMPENKSKRGLIMYGEEHCIYCLKCEKACPPKAILFVKTDNPSQNEKNKKSLQYHYNAWHCIYCAECVRACPKPNEALWQSTQKPSIATKKENPNAFWKEIETLKKEGT